MRVPQPVMVALARWALAFALVALVACEKHDLGKICGTDATAVTDPIGGEEPVIEVVRLERDGECASFQCLTHRGLPPYCTQPCTLAAPPTKQKSCIDDAACTGGDFARGKTGHCVEGKCQCETDDECDAPLQCGEGRCRDDDCPKGFTCEMVQEVGPLAGQHFCALRTGCQRNADCEEFGVMACRRQGCFDACLRGYHRCPEATQDRCTGLECFDSCTRVAADVFYCPDAFNRDEKLATCRDAGCYADCTPLTPDCEFHRLICEPFNNLGCSCPDSDDVRNCADADLQCFPDSTSPGWPEIPVKRLDVCMPEES